MELARYITVRKNGSGTERYYWQRRGFPLTRLPDDPVERLIRAGELNLAADEGATVERKTTDKPAVYVVRVDEFVKIGIAGKLKHRLRNIQSSLPSHLRVVAALYVSDERLLKPIERAVHDELAESRVRGEWFRISDKEARAALRKHCGEHDRFVLFQTIDRLE
jgi:hypothetical protein